MNWSYTKNIIIILLVLLNILLLSVRIGTNKANYTIQEKVEDNIRNILKIYDYQLYTFLPSEFYPMRPAIATSRRMDAESISKHFFSDMAEVKKTNEGNKEIYFIDDKTYCEVYRNGKVIYYYEVPSDNEVLKDNVIDKDEAYDLVSKFMLKVYKGDRVYKAIGYDKENNIFKYEYYSSVSGNLVFNDYIKINVYQDHIEAEMWGMNVQLSSEPKKNILPIDEVLFNFVKNVRNENLEEKYITDIELGYYAINEKVSTDGEVIEYPYYKISVKYDSEYFINAYTNEIYDKNLIKIY